MTEDPPQKYPAYKLGEYTVVGEIAEGTFGKVKSTCMHFCILAIFRLVFLDGNGQWPYTPSPARRSL